MKKEKRGAADLLRDLRFFVVLLLFVHALVLVQTSRPAIKPQTQPEHNPEPSREGAADLLLDLRSFVLLLLIVHALAIVRIECIRLHLALLRLF